MKSGVWKKISNLRKHLRLQRGEIRNRVLRRLSKDLAYLRIVAPLRVSGARGVCVRVQRRRLSVDVCARAPCRALLLLKQLTPRLSGIEPRISSDWSTIG